MSTRLDETLGKLCAEGSTGPYIYVTTGADVTEPGLPFPDPMADGPVIQDGNIDSGIQLIAAMRKVLDA